MIIYNITNHVDKRLANEWLTWLKEEHIKKVMETECFTEYKIVRLLEVDESEGVTYAIQFTAESKADYNRYIETHSVALRQQSINKWGDAVIAFRSVMQVVE